MCAAESDARAAAATAQREGQDGRILLGATAGWRKTANETIVNETRESAQGNAPAGEGDESRALNPMPGPKYVTERGDDNTSDTGALLGRQEKPESLPGATSASCDGDGAGGNRLAAGF